MESEQLQRFGLNRCNRSFQIGTSQTVATVCVRFPFSHCAGPASGAGAISYNTVPVRPSSKEPDRVGLPNPNPSPGSGSRHWRRRQPAATGGGARGHGFPLIAHENSKYPKGTPFVPIFLYLNTSNFHPMSNVGLNAFSYI